MRGRQRPLCRRRASAGQRLHHRHRHGKRRHQKADLLRRPGQCGSAHHPGPQPLRGRGLRHHGVHLRQPQPHGGVELHREPGEDHRRYHGPGRQRGDPGLRRGPYPGAFVLHPGDQGQGPCEVQPGFSGLHRLASGPPCHHHLYRGSGRLSRCRRSGAGAGRHPHVQLLQPPHDGDGGGIQGAERGRYPQGHHLRLRYVRRGPYPSPPEAQPLEAGVHHRVRGLSGGGHLGPLPAGGRQKCEALRRGDRRSRQDRELSGPFLPCRPGSPAGVDR